MNKPASPSASSWPESVPEQETGSDLRSVWSPGARNGDEGHSDPSVLAAFQDYVRLMPLVAEANQMSGELKKVRARKGSDVSSGKDLGEQVQPPSLPLPQTGFMGQMRTRRPGGREGLWPRPRSELGTGSGPTPRPPQSQPRASFLPRLAEHGHCSQRDTRLTRARRDHPTPDCPHRSIRTGVLMAPMLPRRPGLGWLPGDTGPSPQETLQEWSHSGKACSVSPRILLRNSSALS